MVRVRGQKSEIRDWFITSKYQSDQPFTVAGQEAQLKKGWLWNSYVLYREGEIQVPEAFTARVVAVSVPSLEARMQLRKTGQRIVFVPKEDEKGG